MDVSTHFSALDDEEFFVVEGSGWRGRRESDSQVFWHPNSMRAWWHIDKDMSLPSRPHHNHHNHNTAHYVRAVGQDVSPGKCVILSTSKSVRKAMKLWDISGDGGFWKVQLDVRDLGGHLDFTKRARAGTLSKKVGEATVGVAAVGALPLGFQVKLGLVRCSIFLLVFMLLKPPMSPHRR